MAKTLTFGHQQVPVPGFGAMGLNTGMGTDLDLEQSEPVLLKAVELGCTFWDTAVSRPVKVRRTRWSLIAFAPQVAYKNGENEKLLGDFIKKHNVRDKLFGEHNNLQFSLHCIIGSRHVAALVASKCGFDVFGPERKVTNSITHIKEYIEGTIDRLGFTPDLYCLHRIDPST
jgi:aryl-alcohol dehydrogenase-like predicted oxidoreductase